MYSLFCVFNIDISKLKRVVFKPVSGCTLALLMTSNSTNSLHLMAVDIVTSNSELTDFKASDDEDFVPQSSGMQEEACIRLEFI